MCGVDNQNEDGSWGEGKRKDSSTLAVVKALHNIGFLHVRELRL